MKYLNSRTVVSTDWLENNLDRSDLIIVDATWHLPPLKKDAKIEYDQAHIPGARYFDIDSISLQETDLPHMLPSPEDFGNAIGKLGIGNDHHVVVYDSYGLFSAARVWWMFRVFGHNNVSVLNGGSLKWSSEGRTMTDESTLITKQVFKASYRPELVCDLKDVMVNIDTQNAQVLDARARDRFYGKAPEPRPGLRSGHIPQSISLPFNFLLDENSKELLPADLLRQKFEKQNIDINKPIICSCGTGVTACALSLGLYLLGKEDTIVYDGSWTEWGGSTDTPIEL